MRSDPALDTRPPLIIGHRGAMGLAPENTLAGFRAALKAGADAVEFDVMRCQTGEVVIFHDSTVDRLTDGTGRIADMPLRALKELDAGTHFDDEFLGERIPTLTEALEMCRGKLWLNIELKGQGRKPDGLEELVAEEITRFGVADTVFISSFNPVRLFRMKKLNRALRLGVLYQRDMPWQMRRHWFTPWLRPWSLNPPTDLATPPHIITLHKKGYRILVWGVNDNERYDMYCRYGVAGMITDFPNRAAQIVARYRDNPRPPAKKLL